MRTALILAALTAALYLPRLGTAPVYISPDEVVVALNAHAIATTGRDTSGRLLPLYFEYKYPGPFINGHGTTRSGWLPPMIFYATAAVFEVLPVSETIVRLPTALIGILNVVLAYLVGRRLFRSEPVAIASAMFLALTPAHFIHSRFAMDYIYPLPFVLAWMLWLLDYFESNRPRMLLMSTAALGSGMFSYIAATVIMPMLLLTTWVALLWERKPVRAYGIAAAGFLIPALLYVPWLVSHPGGGGDVLAKYEINSAAGISALFTFHRIGDLLGRLWTFYDPRFLFFDGPMELMYSTREVGVFLLPLAPLLVAGLWAIIRGPLTGARLLLIGGLIVSPLPATILVTTDAIYRALELLPCAVLLSGLGVQLLWSASTAAPPRRAVLATGVAVAGLAVAYTGAFVLLRGRLPGSLPWFVVAAIMCLALGWLAPRFRLGQLVVLGLVAVMPLQFATFYRDYMTNYRLRTLSVFSGNIRGAAEEAIRQADTGTAPIYLGRIGPYGKGGSYWPFFLLKYGRSDLAARTLDVGTFEADRVLQLPPGSVIVNNAGEGETDAAIDRLVAAGQVSRTPVREPDGAAAFWVLRRTMKS